MGQYHYIVNLTKKEFLHPHHLDDGLKLREFSSGGLSIQGLTLLLASSNGLGGGDFRISEEFDHISGRWAGDQIVIAGDYDDKEGSPGCGIYSACNEGKFKDISYEVLLALLSNEWDLKEFLNTGNEYIDKTRSDLLKEAKKQHKQSKKKETV